MTDLPEALRKGRYWLKDSIRREVDFSQTGQHSGVPPPPLEKAIPSDSVRIPLPTESEWAAESGQISVGDAIARRRSRRRFTEDGLTLHQLSFLLWATQGIQRQLSPGTALRVVPSAGARHALETYLVVCNVQELDPGVYRYLPVEHELLFVDNDEEIAAHAVDAMLGQRFAGTAGAIFAWAAVPYRMEWRYGAAAHKVIALDAGHVCQNLYLACEAIGLGTCAVAAYDQEAMDRLVQLDGEDEFVIYLAPVGYPAGKETP
jgi:SagB-type dehydrogenase family enzyme